MRTTEWIAAAVDLARERGWGGWLRNDEIEQRMNSKIVCAKCGLLWFDNARACLCGCTLSVRV